MWPFRAKPQFPDLEERIGKLERIAAEDRDHVARSLRALDADMDQLWDKVKRAVGRQSKRDALDAKASDELVHQPGVKTPDDWQREILSRRRNGVPNPRS
jgi:alkylated DNA nucleotide flippase Atl1